MRIEIVAALAAALLLGCTQGSAGRYVEADHPDFRRDDAECRTEARRVAAAERNVWTVISRQDALYRDCMNARGYDY
jgi:hypothetical protein